MLVLVVVALLSSCASAGHEWSLSCAGGGEQAFSFWPVANARYRLRWCSPAADPLLHDWALQMNVYGESPRLPTDPDHCPASVRPWENHMLHSKFYKILNQTTDCTEVCLGMYVDLVYRGCYQLQLTLRTGEGAHPVYKEYLVSAKNNWTLADFNEEEPFCTSKSFGDEVEMTVHSKSIPLDESKPYFCNETACWVIRCAADAAGRRLRCAGPARGSRELFFRLEYLAPWVHSGLLGKSDLFFNFTVDDPLTEPGAPGAAGAARWAAAAAAAAGGAAAAALAALLWRRRGAAAWRRVVARAWKDRYNNVSCEESSPTAAAAAAGGGGVLLLYARDSPHFMRAMAALREMLELVAPGQVYDLFTPTAMALCGGAPSAWLRGLLAGGARVLLLQTLPAALYADTAAGPAVGGSLLPRRVAYRQPHYGDTLLQYALRLLQEHAHASTAYKQYYLASVSSLPAEMMPQVVPFRRYELPGALGPLLRDLAAAAAAPADPDAAPAPPAAAPAAPPALEAAFRAALRDHVTYVTEHPNYLQDDLLMIL